MSTWFILDLDSDLVKKRSSGPSPIGATYSWMVGVGVFLEDPIRQTLKQPLAWLMASRSFVLVNSRLVNVYTANWKMASCSELSHETCLVIFQLTFTRPGKSLMDSDLYQTVHQNPNFQEVNSW